MAYDGSENLRYSRSGRVLKKTLKIKEMEELEAEEIEQEKYRRQSSISSKLQIFTYGLNAHNGESKSSSSESSRTSSPDISVDETFATNIEKGIQTAVYGRNNSKYCLFTDDICSSEEGGKWSNDVLTQGESNSSTLESGKGRSKRRISKVNSKNGIKMRLNTSFFKQKMKKSFHSTKIISHRNNVVKNKFWNQKKKFSQTRRKTKNIESGGHFDNRQIRVSSRLRKLPYVLRERKKEVCHGKVGPFFQQCSISYNEKRLVDKPEQLVRSDFDRGVQEETVKLFESPLGIAPIDVAAHLKLLGDNLSNIGLVVSRLDFIGTGVYSVLLDLLLCAVGPMLCLTKEIAGLEELKEDVFVKILDHIAYIIPGLQ